MWSPRAALFSFLGHVGQTFKSLELAFDISDNSKVCRRFLIISAARRLLAYAVRGIRRREDVSVAALIGDVMALTYAQNVQSEREVYWGGALYDCGVFKIPGVY